MPEQAQAVAAARADLVRYGRRMASARLAAAGAGSISIRAGEVIVMTPPDVTGGEVTAGRMLVLDSSGTVISGTGTPPPDWPVHRLAYAGTGAGAVVHARSPFALAVSAACDAIPAVHYAIMALGGPDVRAGRGGGLAAALDGRHGALVRSDGAVARGTTLAQAWDRAELLEWLAEVYWRARAAGTPRILSPAELGAVTEQARRHRYPGLS